MKLNFILTVCFLSFSAHEVCAQSIGPSIINSTGGSGSISGKEFEWSVGEMALVSTSSSPTIVVTQGILQPKAGFTAVPAISLIENLRVFPNPSNAIVNIELNAIKDGQLNYTLTNMTGRTLAAQYAAIKQGNNTLQLDISVFAAATYMLRIIFLPGAEEATTLAYKIEKLR